MEGFGLNQFFFKGQLKDYNSYGRLLLNTIRYASKSYTL